MFFSSLLSMMFGSSLLAGDVSAGRLIDIARDPHQLRQRMAAQAQTLEHDKRQDQFRFLNNQTKQYRVEKLPDVHFDIGEMYSGLIPIDEKDPSRALFFVFQPTIGPAVDEITIWLNGGPGCSSLEGFLQENGRFLWKPGTFAPVENPYSWVNLTNMLWVEQPVGTGFSIGTPTATTEEETAADFIKFFKNFEQLFGIKKFKIYVTGESYAGRYVPYISAGMLDEKDDEYFDLGGALMYDPCIGQFDYVSEVPAVPFVRNNLNLFNFNTTFMSELEHLHQKCGYQDFLDKYYAFPASGVQPPKFFNSTVEDACDVFSTIYTAATTQNPCFNPYEVNQMCPILWDVLDLRAAVSPGTASEAGSQKDNPRVYFDRPDVKQAMHAPLNITWRECSLTTVFKGVGNSSGPEQEGDTSANPIETVLPQIIEATNRVLISNGDYDYMILTNGTLLSIQNMTWNGRLGFEREPSVQIVIELRDLQSTTTTENSGSGSAAGQGQGVMGVQHFERGLMWAETYQSGHMGPEFQPRVAWRHLEWLLKRVDVL